MAEGGCTTCCALLSAAFVLIGCAEPLAISTSESMIVLLHSYTTRRMVKHNFQTPSRPQPRSPSAVLMTPRRKPCDESVWFKNKIATNKSVTNLRSPLSRCATHAPYGRTKGVITDLSASLAQRPRGREPTPVDWNVLEVCGCIAIQLNMTRA